MASLHRHCPNDHLWRHLHEWYQTPLGRELFAEEYAHLCALLPNLFGFHLVQIGKYDSRDLVDASRTLHRFVLGTAADTAADGVHIVADADDLPFASDSVDVVLLAHALDFAAEPHAVLREVDRVLIPEGHVVILGFNPFGLWGLWRMALGWRGRVPWCGRFLSQGRVKDWLALLGFDVVKSQSAFFRPPLGQERIMTKLKFMDGLGNSRWAPLGAAYLLVARKRVLTLTPIRARWRPRRSLVAPGIVRPTPREA